MDELCLSTHCALGENIVTSGYQLPTKSEIYHFLTFHALTSLYEYEPYLHMSFYCSIVRVHAHVLRKCFQVGTRARCRACVLTDMFLNVQLIMISLLYELPPSA